MGTRASLRRSLIEVAAMFRQSSFLAGSLAVALMGWAVGVGAQTASESMQLPPLPPSHDGIREVQSQLIALGFDPGPADGETGPATMSAVQQYNESRGGNGPVAVVGWLLARLQQDSGPRLTPEQVAARSRPHYAPAPANPVAGMVQQFESNIRTLLNSGY
jgi:peptidoglycan hydrolase-like protein with peptidoglycan-binding domain